MMMNSLYCLSSTKTNDQNFSRDDSMQNSTGLHFLSVVVDSITKTTVSADQGFCDWLTII